ncbi:PilZ domain-containing protein [[Archangium] primigenium]|uniref:PilZ domain-containing protein n=1 Tax=Melittangium TaxID=44 RepID=UPI00195775AD|nr:PilZ domain-containing protein [Archangium primigenium]
MSASSREDRRASPRVPLRLGIRVAGSSGAFDSREGNVSVGGFAWHGAALSVGTLVEVSLSLPDISAPFLVRGQVLNVSYGARGTSAHARFLDLPVDVERHIARYLDEVERLES